MVFKVAGDDDLIWFYWSVLTLSSDISLAAFGRKEIEIAEVRLDVCVHVCDSSWKASLAWNARAYLHAGEGETFDIDVWCSANKNIPS